MKRLSLGMAALAAVVLASCGNGNNGAASNAPGQPPTEEQVAHAQAQAVFFDPALQKPQCLTHPDVSRFPAPELAGVRLGMTRGDALATVFCQHQNFHVQSDARYFDVNTRGENLGPQTIEIYSGTRRQCGVEESMDRLSVGSCRRYGEWVVDNKNEAIFLATPGLPGQERLLGIWRYQQFTENPPTVEATVNALIARFGQPGRMRNGYGDVTVADLANGTGDIDIAWVWDTAGTALTSANPQLQQCASSVNANYQGSQGWSEDCGLTVVAKVSRSSNAAIASAMQVGMLNQQVMYRVGVAMEQHYAQAADAQRQQEIERARGASTPNL